MQISNGLWPQKNTCFCFQTKTCHLWLCMHWMEIWNMRIGCTHQAVLFYTLVFQCWRTIVQHCRKSGCCTQRLFLNLPVLPTCQRSHRTVFLRCSPVSCSYTEMMWRNVCKWGGVEGRRIVYFCFLFFPKRGGLCAEERMWEFLVLNKALLPSFFFFFPFIFCPLLFSFLFFSSFIYMWALSKHRSFWVESPQFFWGSPAPSWLPG